MQARRVRVEAPAAVFSKGVCAGNMASRKGSEIAAPIPRSTARRETCFFVINIDLNPPDSLLVICRLLYRAHLKLRARDNSEKQRREAIIIFRGLSFDRA